MALQASYLHAHRIRYRTTSIMGYGEACLRGARFMMKHPNFFALPTSTGTAARGHFIFPWCFGDSGACLHALLRPVELAHRLGDLKPGGYRPAVPVQSRQARYK